MRAQSSRVLRRRPLRARVLLTHVTGLFALKGVARPLVTTCRAADSETSKTKAAPKERRNGLRPAQSRLFAELLRAVETGNERAVRTLIKRGADVNGRNVGDDSAPMDRPIVLAAAKGNMPILELLLAAGADPNWCCCSCI